MLQKLYAVTETLKLAPAELPETIERNLIEHASSNEILRKDIPFIGGICGPTASGKTTIMANVCAYLSMKGLAVASFSTDNYYKGIARMVFDPVIAGLPADEQNQIIRKIRGIIQNDTLANKGSAENAQLIALLLQQHGLALSIADIQARFKNINFDDPDAIDFALLVEHLGKIVRKEPFDIPEYSMDFSEPIASTKRFAGKEQAVLIEGINAFDKRILPYLNTKAFVNVPTCILLIRRIWRDIFKHPTNFAAEQLLQYLLTTAFPAYLKNILPAKKQADIIIDNTLTLSEIDHKLPKEYQAKIIISPEEAALITQKLHHIRNVKEFQQVDYFLKIGEYNEGYLRLREEAKLGETPKLSTLMYIGQKVAGLESGILYNPRDILISEADFDRPGAYTTAAEIIHDVKAAGIELLCQHEKTRTIYRYNKAIHIDIDRIKDGAVILSLKVKQQRIKDIPAEFETVKEYFTFVAKELLGERAFTFMADFDPSTCND